MKVLIISHNPMSPVHSIGKTLLSLFSQFKKQELCQIYIHTGYPENDACNSFYRVTDKDVLKGVFSRRVKGKMVCPVETKDLDHTTALYKHTYGSHKNRQPHREILRDVMWRISPWYNKVLKLWIEKEKPTCIFAAIGSGTFLYDMAVKISKDYHIPLITYVCDDFYSMKAPPGAVGRLWKRGIEKKSKKLFEQSAGVVSICNELSDLYRKEFQKPTYTIMTGTNYAVNTSPIIKNDISTLRYFGKLSLNRYLSLASVCRAIDEINKKRKIQRRVEIYTGCLDEDMKNAFKNIKCARFFGFITGEEFQNKFFSSDALIHIEAFDEQSIDRVKNSVSTKIADSLASGIPLLAYGPSSVASISHLIRNNCAMVATGENELQSKLADFFENTEKRKTIIQNQINTAEQYHDPKKVSAFLYEALKKINAE